ncbi:hypothetical protein [Halobaculum magnesiiphilum]|uniref:Uncharacterized protein n=1 Tax=Halobaculum magnesiiphilum TaxID=1017351 RepID=A0A8T8WAL5_9EURY|nr:hypothetical protein [Halobaculum magnesiiphilum]QZP36899.1 hypothetical protein K6T50_11420 [Halobaculum magnesiiphilum]
MSLHDDLDARSALPAALGSAALVAFAFVAFGWLRLSSRSGTPAGDPVAILGALLIQAAVATVTFAPFLLAVVGVVARPTPRVVAGGAALVYGVDLLVTVGTTLATGFPGSVGPLVLVVPLSTVVSLLAIAVAVWLAYHGGYERLAAAAEGADRHPLFANLPKKSLGPGLSVKRGLVAAGLAALVGAGGLVAANGLGDLLRAATRAGAGGSVSVTVTGAWARNVGIPPSQFPVEWLSEASFLLAVLFVAGPRVAARDLGKGIAVIVGVQSATVLVPAFVASARPLDLWAPSGPLLAPLGDVFLFVGIAVAVRLALHGDGPVRTPTGGAVDG